MSKSAMIRARTEPALKSSAEEIFHKLGISCSEAINIFFRQVTLRRGLPFEVIIPNKTTLGAMKDVEQNKTKKTSNLKSLFNELGI